ncbi:sensor histidine kinase [Streptosporangium saharense]|uniref:Signal transduction histidine kinase n=1 Tax=Streptosporangium saharense TaxID=1706840 RepID=A0A7W7QIS2_9ACTN|nr:histidine kinase [Streptosporangium saharense]MBB4914304.1 signal transduction histidine kinase [Streptosporangium saharense]
MEEIARSDTSRRASARLRSLAAVMIAAQCGFWGARVLDASFGEDLLLGGLVALAVAGATGIGFLTLRRLGDALVRWRGHRAALEAAKAELLCAAAIAQERERIARDLHDLLSHGISTITLKGELARRITPAESPRVREELSEIIEISRKALADVRELSHNHSRMSLRDELDSVRSTLSGLGIRVEADISPEPLDPDTGTVLAIVLREGVTNLLKHGTGRWCEIAVRSTDEAVTMVLANDCAPGSPWRPSRGGNGLANLAARVATVNGRFSAARSGGRFVLEVAIPQGTFSSGSSGVSGSVEGVSGQPPRFLCET